MFKWLFKKTKYITVSHEASENKDKDMVKPNIPFGLWLKCPCCGQIIYNKDLKVNSMICSNCNYHFRISAWERIESLADDKTFAEFDRNIKTKNPLNFEGYENKIEGFMNSTKMNEAVITGKCRICGVDTVICVMDSRFFMGSMGSVVGEKITRAVERSTEENLPVIIFTASGGARMQEGMFSLMQMAKVSAAIARHSSKGLLYITVLTDPTTGGVTASFGSLGDIIIAEPGALVGFAGKRVIQQTIGQKLPEGFQRAEFLLKHGFIDKIVQRKDMREILADMIKMHSSSKKIIPQVKSFSKNNEDKLSEKTFTPWQKVNLVRMTDRPSALDYIERIFDNFIEFHGDRSFGDDAAIVGGIGLLGGESVTVIGQQKGRNTRENIKRNFGMPNPEGYRKAARLMKQAEKFGRPVVCFIDTPGAFCGIGAEERGQGEAIAYNIMLMSELKVPIISINIGEGSSGGALALGVSDEVWMLQNAVYSILSPEGFASILWRDSSRAEEAAGIMQITAQDLMKSGIIDKIIKEPGGGAHESADLIASDIKSELAAALLELKRKSTDELLSSRYNRYRSIGVYSE